MTKPPIRLDFAAGWLLVAIGALHLALIMRRSDARQPHLFFLLAGGVLVVAIGVGHLAAVHYLRDSAARAARASALAGSVLGIVLSLTRLRSIAPPPQALPFLMLFTVTGLITLSRPPRDV